MPTREEQLKAYEALQKKNIDREREEAGYSGMVQRGIEGLQSTGGAALEAAGDITGIDYLQETGEEIRVRNAYEAELAAPAGRSLGDDPVGAMVDLSAQVAPSLAVMGGSTAALAGAGFLVGGPIGAAVGGFAGLLASSFGLNLGTIKEIEESIDPESKSNLMSLVAAGGASAFDVWTGGTLTTAARETIKQGVKTGFSKSLAKEAAYQTAKETGIATGLTAGSILSTEIGATLSTGAVFDEDRIDAITENTLTGMLLAPFLAAPVSGGGQALATRAAIREMRENAQGSIHIDPETGGVTVREPNSLATMAPDVWKMRAAAVGLGRAVDSVVRAAPENSWVRRFAYNLDQTFEERAHNIGRRTVNTEAQQIRGDFHELADLHTLKYLRKRELERVEADIRAGRATREADNVRSAFNDLKERARAAGIRMGDLGPTYLPFMPSIKKIKADRQGFIDDMFDALTFEKNYSRKKMGEILKDLEDYTDQILGDGAIRVADEAQMSDKLVEALARAAEGDSSMLRRPFVDINKPGKINTNNNLEKHRFLSGVDSERLKKWEKDDVDLVDRLELYSQLATERIAYADRFGANNEKLNEMVRRAIVEGLDTGKHLSQDAVDKMFDLANLQQRLTSKTVSPEYRRNVAAAKTAMNVLTLPLATISSLQELLFLVPKTGMKPFITGGAKTLDAMGRKLARSVGKYVGVEPNKIPRSDAERQLSQMNTSMREAMVSTMARIGDSTIDPTKIDQWFFRANLLSQYTMFTRAWAQLAAIDAFKEAANTMVDSTKSSRVRRNAAQKLTDAGLDPNAVRQWVDNGAPKDVDFYRQIQAGAIDVAEDVIFHPNPVNKPAWTSHPNVGLQFLSHLKTFPLQFNNRIVLPVARRIVRNNNGIPLDQAIAMATTLGFATIGFTGIDALKTFIRDGSLDKWEEKSVREHILVSAAQIGMGGILLDPARTGSYGGSALESIAGPALSKSAATAGGAMAVLVGEKSPEDALKDVLTSLPSIAGSRQAIKDAM